MADGLDAFAADAAAPLADVGSAERAVIACAISDETRAHKAVARASVVVAAGDFSNAANARVWEAVLAVHARGDVVDAVMVAEELDGDPKAQRALAEAASLVVSCAEVDAYAERVAAHAYRRSVVATLRDAYHRAAASGDPVAAVTSSHEALAAMPKGPRGRRDDSMKASVVATIERIVARYEAMRRGERATARWGVAALDGYTDESGGFFEGAVGGLFPGKLYVIAGVPAAGKTTLAWQATLATARGDEYTPGRRVLVFSLEMSREDICQRLAAQACGVSEARIENGAISDGEANALIRFLSEDLAALPINIVTACRTIEEMRARVLAEMAAGDVGLVVIDFLQRAKMGRRTDNANRDDQDRVYEAKGIANEGVPVIAISSMSKASQTRANEGKVGVADTSGSGTEYAADFVAFLIRTNPDDKGGKVEVRFEVAKRRNGPASPATLMLDLTKGRFETVNGRRDVGATDDDAPWSAEG